MFVTSFLHFISCRQIVIRRTIEAFSGGLEDPAFSLWTYYNIGRKEERKYYFCFEVDVNPDLVIDKNKKSFFVYFFGGLECVGHSFASVAHFVFLRAATQLPFLDAYTVSLEKKVASPNVTSKCYYYTI
jgi:hypothetical protein